MKAAVVILNWNGKALLEKFLPSVIEHSNNIAEVIIADNNSNDGSLEFLKAVYPELRIIENKKNFGFAGGYNEALKQVEADYYVLLNSDIQVSSGWLKGIIELMDADTSIAACQPKILSYSEPEKFEYAGAAGGFIDKLGYPFCRGRIFQSIEKDTGQYDDTVEIFWATGACMFVRSELFHKLGGFDHDFFAHMEEIDLCWRFKNNGYKVFYYPKSVIYHVGGATLNKMSAHKTFLNFRNNLSLIYKNIPQNKLNSVLTKRAFLDFVAAVKFIFSGGFSHFWAVIKAYNAFYGSLKATKEKRAKIEQKNVSCVYQKSIVNQYYLKKKVYFSQLSDADFS